MNVARIEDESQNTIRMSRRHVWLYGCTLVCFRMHMLTLHVPVNANVYDTMHASQHIRVSWFDCHTVICTAILSVVQCLTQV